MLFNIYRYPKLLDEKKIHRDELLFAVVVIYIEFYSLNSRVLTYIHEFRPS